jgi:hypothetical protein
MPPGSAKVSTPPVRFTRTGDGVRLAYAISGAGADITIKVACG